MLRLWSLLSTCERSVEQRLAAHLRQNHGITLPQFEVLSALDRCAEPVVMARLSESLHVTSSNLTGVVDRLERSGLVKRSRSREDRRLIRAEMTAKGRATHAKIATDNALWIARAFTELRDEEIIELQRLLGQVCLSANKAPA